MKKWFTFVLSSMCLLTSVPYTKFYKQGIAEEQETKNTAFNSEIAVTKLDEDEGASFLGLATSYEVQAHGKQVKIPQPYVYDSIDVGLSYTVKCYYGEEKVNLKEGRIDLIGLGAYRLIYTTVNSRGIKTEVETTLRVLDEVPPSVFYDCEKFFAFTGKEYSVPEVSISDYFTTQKKVYLVEENRETLVENYFTINENCVKLKYEITEISENALTTVFELPIEIIAPKKIYGFNDLDTEKGLEWGKVQSDLSTADPIIYQVPVLSQNESVEFDFDGDGKSFKVEVLGKENCNELNSWPAILTWELDLGFIDRYERLTFMVYNACEDREKIKIGVELNFMLHESFTAKQGEWTKIVVDISGVKTKYGASTLQSIKIFTDGFEDGRVVYYLDNMLLE